MSNKLALVLLATLPLAGSAHAAGGFLDKAVAGAKTARTVMKARQLPLSARVQATLGIAGAVVNPRQHLVDGTTPTYFQTGRQLESGAIASSAVLLQKDGNELFYSHGKAFLTDGVDSSTFSPALKATSYTKRVDVTPSGVLVRTQRDDIDGRAVSGTQKVIGTYGLELTYAAKPGIYKE